MDDLDRVRHGLPMFETAGGSPGWSVSARAMEGYRSLAKWANVPLELVMRHMANGTASTLIETRAGRQAKRRNLSRIEWLYRRRELAAKQVPPWS
jgi:hypothetical protein